MVFQKTNKQNLQPFHKCNSITTPLHERQFSRNRLRWIMKLCHNNVLQTTSKYTINNLICPPCYFSKHQQPCVTVWQKVPTFCQWSTLILSFSLSFRWFWKRFSHFLITSINNFLRLIAFIIQIYHLDDI